MSVHQISRRRLVQAAGAIASSAALPAWIGRAQAAEPFPSKPFKFVVPFPAGSGTDTTARLFGKALGDMSGQPVTVENRGGGNGFIAVQAVLSQPADGHTLLLGSNSVLSTNTVLLKNMPYDPERDFVPIARMTMAPCLVVVPGNSRIRSMAELIAKAKQAPGALNYASGSASYMLYTEWFNNIAGIKGTEVPYKGASEAVNSVASGVTDYAVVDSGSSIKLAASGVIRALAFTAEERSPHYPGVPTSAEAGLPEFLAFNWGAAVVSAKTPQATVDYLRRAFAQGALQPEVKGFYGKSSTAALSMAIGEDFTRFQKEEIERWKRIARIAGIQAV